MTLKRTDPLVLPRTFPHVDDISDWRAQQSVRLLWDRAAAVEGRLQALEASVGDLVKALNAQEDQLAAVRRAAGEALALVQATLKEKTAATDDTSVGRLFRGKG